MAKKKTANNDSDVVYFEPVYYYENEPMFSIKDVKNLFLKLLDKRNSLNIEFKNNPMVEFMELDSVYERFAILHTTSESGEKTRYTIPFYDVLSYEVMIEGEDGRLKLWGTTFRVPERGMKI